MDDKTERRIKELISRAISEGETAGASLLIRQDGRELLFHSEGFADIENKKPLDRESIFRLYSMTKPITSIAAMLLVERGELDMDMPVSEALPAFSSVKVLRDGTPAAPARPMTVLQLLNMCSGLSYGDSQTPEGRQLLRYIDDCSAKMRQGDGVTTIGFANGLADIPLSFEPDGSWSYGFSADVLGAVIERVSGLRFGEFLEKNIFAPLGMRDTGFWVPPEKRARLAEVYESTGSALRLFTRDYLLVSNRMDSPPAFESGGAGLASTIDDYARLAQMLLNGGSLDGERIMSPQTVSFMLSGGLTDRQQQAFRAFGKHEGYTYTHLFRRLADPGQACLMSQRDEYGWASWLGNYFANIPGLNMTILLMQQRVGAGTAALTRKIRNVLTASL